MQFSESGIWRSSLEIIKFRLEGIYDTCQFKLDPVQSKIKQIRLLRAIFQVSFECFPRMENAVSLDKPYPSV